MRVRVPGPLQRPVPFLISVAIHGALVAVLWLVSNGLPQKTPSAYDQLFKGKEKQILVYRFHKLPAVRPLQNGDTRPLRAEIQIPAQQIVASPKNAPKGKQLIWQPVPDLLPKEVPLPNILALKAPPVAAPERKQFTPPAEIAKAAPALAQPKVLDAPQQIKVESRLPEQLGAAPKLTIENRPRFIAPQAQPKPALAAIQDAGAAPALAAAQPAAPLLSGVQSNLDLAVVGLQPSPASTIPKGSRAAEFSAGRIPRTEGGTGSAGKGLTVPDLFVSGESPGEAKPTLMARLNAAPTSAEALRGMSKYAAPAAEPAASARPSAATRVSGTPNPRFDGREVYTMAIQMPNITSYSGSWLMWYSGREAGRGPVAPPLARRKVDPKYIAKAAEERVEGKVVLLCIIRQNGHVDQVELVRGIDDRLNQSAVEALSKWDFQPASRGGEPVDVDVMVEIPFRLAPRVAK